MRQCDPLWGSEKLGFSADKTICTSGSAVTCLAMLLDDSYYGGALGWVSPKTLNTWLIANNGYTNENQVVWSFVELLGNPVDLWAITSSADTVKYYLKRPGSAGSVAILKISEEPHYVLATRAIDYYLPDGVTLGSKFNVEDPRNKSRY